MLRMVIAMNDEQLRTLIYAQGFLEGAVAVPFAVAEDARYAFITQIVNRFDYGRLKYTDKGVILSFLERVSGYSW